MTGAEEYHIHSESTSKAADRGWTALGAGTHTKLSLTKAADYGRTGITERGNKRPAASQESGWLRAGGVVGGEHVEVVPGLSRLAEGHEPVSAVRPEYSLL